nr:FHA domain-containing protein [Lachnospiraceae bacterium]
RNGSFNDEISIFDPEDSLREATVILSDDDREFSGKLIYEGNGDEKDYLIDKIIFKIGSRSEDNDANLNSKVVSRHHARITVEKGIYYLEDLNSTNGTFINGKLIDYREKVRLNRMDSIHFADVRYRIV